ncbi:hypothetical protein GIB67_007822 [Kingdonia uniflora]|uniref:CYTH domain-containing protein n=1 Tax=Kingdonia uniflora TaxID=39325 RepID=A0A7J7N1V5_9MAGN|nr:hypothetical protein GIB67_007822 [Kingdonia uniflora]
MYKTFIEPDLQMVHIKIVNKFNPFTGFQKPTYILKSTKTPTVDQIKAVISGEHKERMEETYDIFLLPPGEDPEACQSYLWMRNKDGKYNLMFVEWVTDSPFIISPRISFEGINNLNLTKLAVNNRRFEGINPELPAALTNQGVITQLSEQIGILNERMDEFTSHIEELNSKFTIRRVSNTSHQNLALHAKACNGTAVSLFVSGLWNGSLSGSLLPNSSSSSQLARDSPLMDEILLIKRGQGQLIHQLDNFSSLLHGNLGERSGHEKTDGSSGLSNLELIGIPLTVTIAVGTMGFFLFRGLSSRN